MNLPGLEAVPSTVYPVYIELDFTGIVGTIFVDQLVCHVIEILHTTLPLVNFMLKMLFEKQINVIIITRYHNSNTHNTEVQQDIYAQISIV